MAQVDRGDQANRKDDTRALIDVVSSGTTDLGNRGNDWTNSTNGAYREGADDLNVLAGPCEMTVQFDTNNTDSGMLLYLADKDFNNGIQIRMDGSGNVDLRYWDGGAWQSLMLIALPNVGASDRTYTVQWCIRDNPLTTGASDAKRSEATVIDHDTANSYHVEQANHIDLTPTISVTFVSSYFMRWDGAEQDVFSGPSIAWVRVGSRFHSSTEAKGDWVAGWSDPGNSGQSYVQLSPFPTRLGIEDEFAGPALLHAQMAHIRNAMRMHSPIASVECVGTDTLQDDLTDTVDAGMVITQPDDSEYQAHLGTLIRRPVPALSDIFVRVWVQLWNTSTTPDQLEVRVYTDRMPPGHQNGNPDLRYVTLTFTNDDTSTGTPSLKTGTIPAIIHDQEWVWVWLAFSTNNGAASANNRYKVWSWSYEPIVIPIGDGQKVPPMVLPP